MQTVKYFYQVKIITMNIIKEKLKASLVNIR